MTNSVSDERKSFKTSLELYNIYCVDGIKSQAYHEQMRLCIYSNTHREYYLTFAIISACLRQYGM